MASPCERIRDVKPKSRPPHELFFPASMGGPPALQSGFPSALRPQPIPPTAFTTGPPSPMNPPPSPALSISTGCSPWWVPQNATHVFLRGTTSSVLPHLPAVPKPAPFNRGLHKTTFVSSPPPRSVNVRPCPAIRIGGAVGVKERRRPPSNPGPCSWRGSRRGKATNVGNSGTVPGRDGEVGESVVGIRKRIF